LSNEELDKEEARLLKSITARSTGGISSVKRESVNKSPRSLEAEETTTAATECIKQLEALALSPLGESFPSKKSADPVLFATNFSQLVCSLRNSSSLAAHDQKWDFNYNRFAGASRDFVEFLSRDLGILESSQAQKSTINMCQTMFHIGADFVKLMAASNSWSSTVDAKQQEWNHQLYLLESEVLAATQEQFNQETRKQQNRLLLSKTAMSLVTLFHQLVLTMKSYSVDEFKKHLQDLRDLIHDLNQATLRNESHLKIKEATKILLQDAVQLSKNEGRDPEDHIQVENKMLALVKEILAQRDAI